MSDLVTVPGGTVGTWSPLILRTPGIAEFLGVDRVVPLVPGKRYDAIVGWGRKPNADWSARYAALVGVPFFRLEDGFLRSVGLGKDGDPPLSIVVDDEGIYYDSTRPSRLETLLRSDDAVLKDPELLGRAGAALQGIVDRGLSKYNAARDVFDFRINTTPNILLVDQVRGDLSLRHGGVGAGAVTSMLSSAMGENPGATFWCKAHPDSRRSVLDYGLNRARVLPVPPNANPIRMLQQMDHVYVLTSLLGFEALMCGTRVSVFGSPFYAGWGLTDDRARSLRMRRRRSVVEVFAAAYLLYSRYRRIPGLQGGSIEDTLTALEADRGALVPRGRADVSLPEGLVRSSQTQDFEP